MTSVISEVIPKKKSHKEWRKDVKKTRRKRVRQNTAKRRELDIKKRETSPGYLTKLAKELLLAEFELEQEEETRKRGNEQWLRDEEEAQRVWREQQRLKDLAKEERIKEQEKIRQEFERQQERVRKLKEEAEKLREEEEAKKEEYLKRVNDFIENGGEIPPELEVIKQTNLGKELCPFFKKVGACRFGNQCSRNHCLPALSCVLLIRNFYSHFTLDQGRSTEYDTDVYLEYEEADKHQHFRDFYHDIVPEFKAQGMVTMIRVCCNSEAHLRGNVYVEYKTKQEALIAYKTFNGRWYGGKQISVEFINISDWLGAICGDFIRKRCPRGNACNFLHVFKNPGKEYSFNWASKRSKVPVKRKRDKDIHWRWSESPEPAYPKSSRRSCNSERSRHTESSRSECYSDRKKNNNRESSRSECYSDRESNNRESSRSSSYRCNVRGRSDRRRTRRSSQDRSHSREPKTFENERKVENRDSRRRTRDRS